MNTIRRLGRAQKTRDQQPRTSHTTGVVTGLSTAGPRRLATVDVGGSEVLAYVPLSLPGVVVGQPVEVRRQGREAIVTAVYGNEVEVVELASTSPAGTGYVRRYGQWRELYWASTGTLTVDTRYTPITVGAGDRPGSPNPLRAAGGAYGTRAASATLMSTGELNVQSHFGSPDVAVIVNDVYLAYI